MKTENQDNVMNAEIQEYKEILPAMNVNVPSLPQKEEDLISDDAMLGIYAEILDKIRSDQTEIDDLISKFGEMVFNEGDATTSSKEALVNLIKLKVDASDKMSKVADLMTRVKLKDPFPKYLAAHQNNTIHIGNNNGARKALLQAINKAQKKDKNEL